MKDVRTVHVRVLFNLIQQLPRGISKSFEKLNLFQTLPWFSTTLSANSTLTAVHSEVQPGLHEVDSHLDIAGTHSPNNVIFYKVVKKKIIQAVVMLSFLCTWTEWTQSITWLSLSPFIFFNQLPSSFALVLHSLYLRSGKVKPGNAVFSTKETWLPILL